ncbi:MAG: monofunctional biosynthetic peptidoglycan transglycosylase [Prevotella buccae]|uniref:monofunctional biosynthetic peptidoglycan transglycosylase n=1 Tax=Segatella buccae TaxID=28126 RepID=UPI0001C40C74|nr:monofunctional biosynthetic peptidoglycan transglycosylase [Segatella buccae]EFC76647.1 monofunctional biosynthetic peptidoglycan transglycosylase [Segatella buccae D17]MBS5894765.1 monofunctional biosynthetic peptidoglycan transglycosylase [Segatella buccae]
MLEKLLRIVRWILVGFFVSTILAVVCLRFIPVFITPLMVIRCVEQVGGGESIKMHHHWVPMEEISRHMPVAVMASEDQRFLKHHGFDYNAIEKAAIHNMKGGKRHGASTISQQTAKNVFLWPGRSWIRKGFEVYFTFLIEMMWSKQRIMEVYLNSIEMGDGIYGVDAVAEYHFDTTASQLSRSQCALIAATLPNPRRFNSAAPGEYMRKRQRQIEHEMRFIPSFPKEGEDVDPKTVVGGAYKK